MTDAAELGPLSQQEIMESNMDVLGITSGLARTSLRAAIAPSSHLLELEAELDKIPNNQKMAFLEARALRPHMVCDAHRLSFLNREDFDAKLAARRLVFHWEKRKEVFGPQKWLLPLTLKGAMRDDMHVLRSGIVSVLPFKDVSGRAIVYYDMFRHDPKKVPTDSAHRAFWYMEHVANEDPDVKERGAIAIANYLNVSSNHLDPELSQRTIEMMKYSPLHFRAAHICHPGFTMYVVGFLLSLLDRNRRLRLRVHYGSMEKVLASLEHCSIPGDRLPSRLGGKLVIDQEKWLRERMRIEENRTIYPSPTQSFMSFETCNSPCSSDEVDAVAALDEVATPGPVSSSSSVGDGRSLSPISLRPEFAPPGTSATITPPFLIPTLPSCDNMGNFVPIPNVAIPPLHATETRLTALNESKADVGQARDKIPDQELPTAATRAIKKTKVRRRENKQGGKLDAEAQVTSVADFIPSGGENAKSSTENRAVLVSAPRQRQPQRKSKKNGSNRFGSKGDPRMDRAIQARLDNPRMSLLDALLVGGFVFPSKELATSSGQHVFDSDNISLFQRKNQLLRRLRTVKKKRATTSSAESDVDTVSGASTTDHAKENGWQSQKNEMLQPVCPATSVTKLPDQCFSNKSVQKVKVEVDSSIAQQEKPEELPQGGTNTFRDLGNGDSDDSDADSFLECIAELPGIETGIEMGRNEEPFLTSLDT